MQWRFQPCCLKYVNTHISNHLVKCNCNQEEPVLPMRLGEDGTISAFSDSGICELVSGPLVLMESVTGTAR